ncbi:putative amino acid efflux protein-LysE family [Advenella kashmirensis WT001]|uniref:Putative amino acid efflux protein-LysE family n=1 Tax=Advenella kashmirensis (strain DSM 17095 / LMG 22695 / WT001) TaxID=1036672 RepID=I3UD38_ADVKW|nr:LysE family transporter [Advenella kashmirensis]AFK62926.1 putative amino acid efflux protein-LysE family [Advenella kashmirensis WT001]
MTELLAVITISILAAISPGPDFAMVTRNSLLLSRRAGVLTALGIGLGVLFHVTYTILGVGMLIQQSLLLFNSIKLAGAAYLIYLGIKMLRTKPSDTVETSSPAAASDFSALRVGFFTNALNPKTTIFIVSLFMQVVQPMTPLSVQIGYGAIISAAHILWFSLVALLFSSGSVRVRLLAVWHWIDWLFGGVLVGFGVLLATTNMSR